MHAGYLPDLPMEQQPEQALLWRVTSAKSATAHPLGKIAVVGHTIQRSGEVLDLGFLLCIDTNCVRGGWLTAIDTVSGKIWQVDSSGRLRPRGSRA
jgi:serine/threonine protein phosphatase 1